MIIKIVLLLIAALIIGTVSLVGGIFLMMREDTEDTKSEESADS